MDKAVFTELLKEKIAGRKVTDALFTTYSFEIDFFELDVVSALMDHAFSPSELIRRSQLELAMRESDINVDVYYDQSVFPATISPSLECGYIPVNLAPLAFHPKLSILRVESQDSEKEASILVFSGSNNLTRAGWWDNIECSYCIELSAKDCPANHKTALAEILNTLQDYAKHHKVAKTLLDSLESMPESAENQDIHFFFGQGKSKPSFSDFLESHLPQTKAETLELISPYFTNDDTDKLLQDHLLNKHAKQINVLLPIDIVDQRKQVQVSEDFYNIVDRNAEIYWCKYDQKLADGLVTSHENHRKTHAKVFHFVYPDSSWIFIGSVNASYRAFFENVESGFLIKTSRNKNMLSTLTSPPDFPFLEKQQVSDLEKQASPQLPALSLVYDWQSCEFTVLVNKSGSLKLCNVKREAFFVIEDLKKDEIHNITQQPPTALTGALEKSALIYVQFSHEDQDAEGWAIVEQRNIYIRPSPLKPLNIQEILQLFSNVGMERRMQIVHEQVAKTIRLKELNDEFIASTETSDEIKNFFSEFTEINSAFWQLKRHLQRALDKQRTKEVLYVLEGEQIDSLRGMLKSLQYSDDEASGKLSGVSSYLIFLSIRQIIRQFGMHANKERMKALSQQIDQQIQYLKDDENSINFVEMNAASALDDRNKFFDWFEQEFDRQQRSTKEHADA